MMEEHCRAIDRSVNAGDYVSLATLLSLHSGKQLLVKLCKDLATASLTGMVAAVSSINDDCWREVSLNHLRCLKAEQNLNFKEAFPLQLDIVQSVLRDVLPKGDRKMLPAIYTITQDLWQLATTSGDEETEEEAARAINKAFTVCITDRSALPVSRKFGCYKLLGLLMRVYFHRNQLTLCTQLLRALATADMPSALEFPKSHLTAFHYYHGRFLMSSGRYQEALEQLRIALCYTYSASLLGSSVAQHNLCRIYRFYFALHIACHPLQRPVLPAGSPPIFHDLFPLIATGQIWKYRQSLSVHFGWLAKHELLVLFQKFDIITVRNAVKIIHDLLEPPHSRTKLSLQLIYNMANGSEVWPLGIDHLASHLSSLISTGAIRGYVSLSPPYLVLSGREPFPPFSLL